MGLKGITIETPPQAEAHINAADDRAIWEAVIGMDGVVNVGQKLKATLISNNLLRVYDGALVVGGAVGRIPFGEYEDITINNGTQNQLRNDLVVAQIEANGAIENMKLHYIQGVPGEVAKDPDYTVGNVYEGETLRQYPLYRVKLNGLNVEAVEPLFEVLPNLGKVKDEVGELNRNLPQGIPLSAEQSGVLALESARLKIIYGTYPLNAFINHQESGGYAKEFDISKYGLKDPVWGTASARYPNGHPHVFIGVVNANKLILLSDANVSDGYAHWMVIGNY